MLSNTHRRIRAETIAACHAIQARGEIVTRYTLARELGIHVSSAASRLTTLRNAGHDFGQTDVEARIEAASATVDEIQARIDAVHAARRKVGRALATHEVFQALGD